MIKNIIKIPFIYSVLVDILIITLVIVSGFILSETVLPGIVSIYISPFILFGCMIVIALLTAFVARIQHIYFPIKNKSMPMIISGTLIFSIFVAIASYRFGYILCAIFTIFSMITFILLYNTFREKIS